MFNTSLSKAAPFHELMYICLNHTKIQNNVSNHRGHYSFISYYNTNIVNVILITQFKRSTLFLTAKKL